MTFRPLREIERVKVMEMMEKVKTEISIRQRYLKDLESELSEGIWVSDLTDQDFRDIEMIAAKDGF